MLTEEEAQEQYKQLKEEELCCQLLHQKIQDRKRALKEMQGLHAKHPEQVATAARNHKALMPRPWIIMVEDSPPKESEDEGDGEYHLRYYQHRRYYEDKKSPLLVELYEVSWLRHFNPATLSQFDGESKPKEFLLKYDATIETTGGGLQ